MHVLQSLELCDNGIEQLEEISILANRCPLLKRLDLRENEVAMENKYLKTVVEHFPKLEWHNNQSMLKGGDIGRDKLGAFREKDGHAVDGLFRNESCSCVEGNPCIDRITCKDWDHRYEIAEA